MKRVLLVGMDPAITVESAAHLKEQLETDFPDRTVHIIGGLTGVHDLTVNEITEAPHAD